MIWVPGKERRWAMRVFYWSLIALLTLLVFPLAAWGIAITGSPAMTAIAPGPYACAGIIGWEQPAIYAVDPNQPLPAEDQPEDHKAVPVSYDALPPTTATEILAAMRSEGQREQPGRPSTKMLPQVPDGLAHIRPGSPPLRQYV
jgi:hypothetical protein